MNVATYAKPAAFVSAENGRQSRQSSLRVALRACAMGGMLAAVFSGSPVYAVSPGTPPSVNAAPAAQPVPATFVNTPDGARPVSTGPAGQPNLAVQGYQQPQQQAVPPEPPPEIGEGVSPTVFKQVLGDTLPLSPDQVKTMKKTTENLKKAREFRPFGMPNPVHRTVVMTFSPANAPEVIRLGVNLVSTIIFTDTSGAPWPAERVVVGNKEAVVIPELEGAVGGALKAPTNILTFAPKDDYASTNVSILLQGAPFPITMMVVAGQKSVDMSIAVNVRARGPHAVAPIMETTGGSNVTLSSDFTAFLDGVPPDDARALKVDNADVAAWLLNGKLMLRTRFNVLSPYVFRRATAPDGTAVYEVAQASVVNLMNEGREIVANISGFPPPALEALRKSLNQ